MIALVARGDKTTKRGEVLSGSSAQYDEEGHTLAVDLDWASCGKCSGGPFHILGSVSNLTDEGRKMVKDLDPVHCPCRKNHVLAKRQDYLIKQGRAHKHEQRPYANRCNHDEQIRIVDDSGRSAANCLHHITDDAGKIYQGLTDENGRCPRVYTTGQKTFVMAVDLKALER
ncbi:PAAR domain-containing protein [Dyella caseinilytica]|uniref:PAAR domain-containing protein n=1 Tax=Dyella caseinilytica TaxID=1849581 RepID=A0ABX7GY08_9GAMM|nr:PAAR domain-containing protein [Dyella caseinilytica]QRN54913.1 PAAR domain-containing protein [Dyella caseinilytica]GFZ97875.1 hypothetical protein GCM10011408_18000 [Dyella caseinilytica]